MRYLGTGAGEFHRATKLCLVRFQWKKSTTFTMLKRLGECGVLKNENAIVTALVKKEDVQKYESK